MSKVTNLRQFRKRKARLLKDERAAENRVRFGRARAQREQDETTRQRDEDKLDQHRREPPSADSE
ncbi:hypothetical protein ATO7_07827 [Oceanococcus atlanticus]|uniref:Uncharacterized protein n=1 Tax=Oceanococcus atlanticus TaxID=1317117 RepID=A0A1Y1SDC4_9GAMM|nr:DUF4169 family protein [Oceanococcus atlanticus]ORE86931.1 hypothetical protein ATO7_07827 [Oceanococcus atlanticus]